MPRKVDVSNEKSFESPVASSELRRPSAIQISRSLQVSLFTADGSKSHASDISPTPSTNTI